MLVAGIHHPKKIALGGQETIHVVQKSSRNTKRVTAALTVMVSGDWLPPPTPSCKRDHSKGIKAK
jgi:hypothetical protein